MGCYDSGRLVFLERKPKGRRKLIPAGRQLWRIALAGRTILSLIFDADLIAGPGKRDWFFGAFIRCGPMKHA